MAFDLNALNEQQSRKAQQIAEKNYADSFLKYEKMLRAKEKMEIVFARSNEKGDLYTFDENKIIIILPIEKLQETSDTDSRRRAPRAMQALASNAGSQEKLKSHKPVE